MGLSCTYVLLTVAASFIGAGRCAVLTGPSTWRDDIPALCVSASVTAVSCGGAVGPDSLLAHPDDCRLFYYCVSPEQPPVCRQCPADLHFSPSEHVCDTPEHAGCQLTNASTDF